MPGQASQTQQGFVLLSCILTYSNGAPCTSAPSATAHHIRHVEVSSSDVSRLELPSMASSSGVPISPRTISLFSVEPGRISRSFRCPTVLSMTFSIACRMVLLWKAQTGNVRTVYSLKHTHGAKDPSSWKNRIQRAKIDGQAW